MPIQINNTTGYYPSHEDEARIVIDFRNRRKMRDAGSEGAVIDWVVDDKGRIRTVHYHVNMHPACLDVDTAIVRNPPGPNGRLELLLRPNIREKWRRAGWVYLEDLYVAEGRDQDWKTWCMFQEARMSGGDVPQRLSPEEDSNGKSSYPGANGAERPIPRKFIKAIPDEYLPDEVLRRRKAAKDRNISSLHMPPPQRAQQEEQAPAEEEPRGRGRSRQG